MAAKVTENPIFRAGIPKPSFQVPATQISDSEVAEQHWDVTPDGKRFLIDTATTPSEPLTVVLNWTAELKKK